MRGLEIALSGLILVLGSASGQYWSLAKDDIKGGCPVMDQRSEYECQGQVANCWSPGVRDLDCPQSGFCCFNGCVAKCLDYALNDIPVAPKKPHHHHHEEKKPHHHKPHVHKYPTKPTNTPTPKGAAYPKPKPTVHGHPLKHHFPKRTALKPAYPVHPGIGSHTPHGRQHATNCPPTGRKSPYECQGATHTCWSAGQPDTDCPGNGLCCFDGCANTCLSTSRVPRPRPTPPPRPVNPCQPTPCGPGTTCTVNHNGDPVCQCQPGLVPKPDTITGCGPECFIDPDCPYGLVCLQQKCVEKPDPCENACGPGTTCKVDYNGNAVCNCQPGLVPKPDTITGCGPECERDYDCQTARYGGRNSGLVCRSFKCVDRPDPCIGACGPRTTCTVNAQGNPVCDCLPGFIPKPDTITGCGYECTTDYECAHKHEHVCMDYKCVPRPDPCHPNPCGPGAYCEEGFHGNAICHCEEGLIPKPDTVTGCGPQCVIDDDCPVGFICQYNKCVERPDPCNPSPCGPGTSCEVNVHGNPICKCLPGLVPMDDTIKGCGPECTTDYDCKKSFGPDFICNLQAQKCEEKIDPCDPSPCGPGTTCEVNYAGSAICKCIGDLIPKPDTITGCGPECEYDHECDTGYICKYNKCVEKPDPCNPNPCGMMAVCTVDRNGEAHCECPTGTFGDGFVGCQQGECLKDADCPDNKACMDFFCINPCLTNSTCRAQDFCQVRNHIPICGFNQGPQPEARTPIVIGGRYNPVQSRPESRNAIVIGASNNGPVQRPLDAVVIEGRRRTSSAGRPRHVIGAHGRRRRRAILNQYLRQLKK